MRFDVGTIRPPNGHAELIEALGNTNALARQLGVDRRRVSRWKRWGIAAAWRPTLADMARDIGVAVPKGFLDPPR